MDETLKPNNELVLNAQEQALYKVCLERNPGIDQKTFMELRTEALKSKTSKFYIDENILEDIALEPKEEALYQVCIKKHPGLTRIDFKELRESALKSPKSPNPGVKKFWVDKSFISEEKPETE